MGEILCFKITNITGSSYVYGTINNLIKNPRPFRGMIDYIIKEMKAKYLMERDLVDINYIDQLAFKGAHRAGWPYVINHMKSISNRFGVICDMYTCNISLGQEFSII